MTKGCWLLALVVGLLLGAGLIARASNGLHPRIDAVARPFPDRPAWMRQPKERNLPETQSHGAQLVVAYCGQCHSPPPPSLHSAAEWRWMIVRMDKRAMRQASPSIRIVGTDELREIARYYETHADQRAVYPPSMTSSAPVMNFDSSDAR